MLRSIVLLALIATVAPALRAEHHGGDAPRGPIAVLDFALILVYTSNDPIHVLANDIVTGLTVTALTQGSNGTVAIAGDSLSVTYTPNNGYLGGDRFTYTITDANNATSTGEVEVGIVVPPPPPPVILAKNDEARVAENSAATTINVLANDIGDGLTVTAVTQGSNGVVAIAADSLSVTYTPNANFFGEDHFTYTITDSKANTSTGKVEVAVIPPLLAVPDYARVDANSSANTINVLANDFGDGLTVTAVTQGANGTVAIAADSLSVTYTPNAGYTGPDKFTYTITDSKANTSTGKVFVYVDNDGLVPIAKNDFATTPENSPAISIDVLANDSGTGLTVTAVTQGTKGGAVAIATDSLSVTYTPAANFAGLDQFTYTITDSSGMTATGNVSVEVVGPRPVHVFAQASPTTAYIGDTIAFFVLVGDDERKASKKENGGSVSLTFAWDFGDGSTSTDRNPTHSYTAAGTYTVSVKVSDGTTNVGAASVMVTIQSATGPVARFTSSKPVAFVNTAITFDGSSSIDPVSPIASYAWDFGDGSPAGSTAVVSHTYAAAGDFIVQLTVTDAASNTASVSRPIHVLPQISAQTFKSFVGYGARLNLTTAGQDSLEVEGLINVGTDTVAQGTAVSVTVVGETFTGTLDATLQDNSQPNQSWKVKTVSSRRVPQGTVAFRFNAKNATLASSFTAAGVVPGANPGTPISVTIPVSVTIGSTTVALSVASVAKFSTDGSKASVFGGGQ